MANDDNPFHSGHTQMLEPDGNLPGQSPGAAPQPGGKVPGYSPSGWGASTMALSPEDFDGLAGAPAQNVGPTRGGNTMSLPTPPGPGGGFGQQGGGNFGPPPGGGALGPPPGGGSFGPPPGGGAFGPAPGGGSAPGGFGGPPQQPGFGPPPGGAPPPGPASGGGGIPYLETQMFQAPVHGNFGGGASAPVAAPAPLEAEPAATVLLDASKMDLSAYGPPAPMGMPGPPAQHHGQAPGPPPPGSFDDGGLAQGECTVILQDLNIPGMAPQPSTPPPPTATSGKLIIFVPDTDPILFELMPGVTTVGRGMENHLVLGDPYASRKHMVITNRGGQYFFEDTGSDNGSLVNGQRISNKPMVPGDIVEIGSVMMRFVQGQVLPEHQQRPIPPSQSGSMRRGRRKKKGKGLQMALLLFFVMATIGMIVMILVMFLNK